MKTITFTTTATIEKSTKKWQGGRTVGLQKLTRADITRLLGGIAPSNYKKEFPDHDGKVKWQWKFSINGCECAIWDYCGSESDRCWSFGGPRNYAMAIFGEGHVTE